jgi:hypothetical protein
MWLMGFDVGKHAPLTNVKFEDRLLEAYHKAPEYIQKTINDLLGL